VTAFTVSYNTVDHCAAERHISAVTACFAGYACHSVSLTLLCQHSD